MIDWSIPAPRGPRPILGTTHLPATAPLGRVLLGHGFKGYKDYGFIPWLSDRLCRAGCIVHRFNFSGSGMDHGHGSFDLEAFRADSWNRQVEDVFGLLSAIDAGDLPGGRGPVLLAGHSRGGVTSLLTAGRYPGEASSAALVGVVTLASPSSCLSLDADDQTLLLEQGSLESPSSRTGQVLRVGRTFLQEQLDDPEGHDLLAQVRRIRVPVLVVHGMADEAVPPGAARELCSALGDRGDLELIPDANHVFNVPNPFPFEDGTPSPQLAKVGEILEQFARGVFSR
ncbi:MAG: hypothetical protein CMJ41_02805 [Phycisphaerae bacterium]|nr:hypothetical protein [Phycisphaerae bacterium]